MGEEGGRGGEGWEKRGGRGGGGEQKRKRRDSAGGEDIVDFTM